MPGKKILIVDDDIDLVRLLSRKIAQAGFEALAAFDASQAFHLAMKESPALILLDIRLPAGGGLGTLQHLKVSSKTSAIPVIIITGQEDPATKREVEKFGVDDFLTKPLDMDLLVAKIRALTGESNAAS